MATQVSLLDGALASAGTLAIQTNGTTSAITISSAQVATFVNNPIMTGLTASRAVFTDGSKGLTSNAITGTGNVVMSASPTLTGTISGAALTLSSDLTLSAGTANGVLYLNGSKVATSGSALTFDGTNFNVLSTGFLRIDNNGGSSGKGRLNIGNSGYAYIEGWDVGNAGSGAYLSFGLSTEQMRLTSTGLGIGTSSPASKLHVNGAIRSGLASTTTGELALFSNANDTQMGIINTGTEFKNYATYASTGGYKPITWYTSDTKQMTLDSSGNLGLGVTPSAWGGTRKAFQIFTASLQGSSGTYNFLDLGANFYYNGTNEIYQYSDYATKYRQLSGQHQWYTAPSGTAGNAITFTQAMTLDASGNLGVGVTSPAAKLDVSGDIIGRATTLRFKDSGNTTQYGAIYADSTTFNINAGVNNLLLYSAGSERARIDSSGNLLVGTTNNNIGGTTTVGINATATGVLRAGCDGGGALLLNRMSSDGTIAFFQRQGTTVGTISVTGSATAYNTSSDYRLKDNIQPMTGALAKVAQLKPVTYKWKADGSDGEGFIAHELAEVVPQCVTGEKDAVDDDGKPVYQGIDTSFLVATLTAAIQEQQAIIEQLKARLDAANL